MQDMPLHKHMAPQLSMTTFFDKTQCHNSPSYNAHAGGTWEGGGRVVVAKVHTESFYKAVIMDAIMVPH